jgi:hypothetical protein
MDYDKMTKAQLIRELEKNEVLSPVKKMTDITFGHVQMVESIGNVLAGKSHMFEKIIKAFRGNNLTITLPAQKKTVLTEDFDCDGCCPDCKYGNMIGECLIRVNR